MEYKLGVGRRWYFTRFWLRPIVSKYRGGRWGASAEIYCPLWARPLDWIYGLIFGETKLEPISNEELYAARKETEARRRVEFEKTGRRYNVIGENFGDADSEKLAEIIADYMVDDSKAEHIIFRFPKTWNPPVVTPRTGYTSTLLRQQLARAIALAIRYRLDNPGPLDARMIRLDLGDKPYRDTRQNDELEAGEMVGEGSPEGESLACPRCGLPTLLGKCRPCGILDKQAEN